MEVLIAVGHVVWYAVRLIQLLCGFMRVVPLSFLPRILLEGPQKGVLLWVRLLILHLIVDVPRSIFLFFGGRRSGHGIFCALHTLVL